MKNNNDQKEDNKKKEKKKVNKQNQKFKNGPEKWVISIMDFMDDQLRPMFSTNSLKRMIVFLSF